MKTPTPETDAHYATTKTAWPQQGDIDFARRIERERDQLRKVCDELEEVARCSCCSEYSYCSKCGQVMAEYHQLPHVAKLHLPSGILRNTTIPNE